MIALFLASGPGHASMIHKWVDQNGVTHYSDEPPPDEQIPTTQIDLPEPNPVSETTQDNYYSIANQWARMNQERLERERLRAQAIATRAMQRPRVTNVYVNGSGNDYGVIYGGRYYKKHKLKHNKHRNPSSGVYPTKYPPGLHPGRNKGGSFKLSN